MPNIFINISGTVSGDTTSLINVLTAYIQRMTGVSPNVRINSQDFSQNFTLTGLTKAKQEADKYKLK